MKANTLLKIRRKDTVVVFDDLFVNFQLCETQDLGYPDTQEERLGKGQRW